MLATIVGPVLSFGLIQDTIFNKVSKCPDNHYGLPASPCINIHQLEEIWNMYSKDHSNEVLTWYHKVMISSKLDSKIVQTKFIKKIES